jgi:catechol 2,3-dioxygenase-like lactoylglutathione lyase family enzyme
MLRLEYLDHLTLTTRDVQASLRFYRDVLGLTPGPVWRDEITMLRCGATYLAIAHWAEGKASAPQPPITLDHFAFRVDRATFEQALVELPKAGVPIEQVSDHGICRSLYVRDPDHHQVELTCYEWRGAPEKMPSDA